MPGEVLVVGSINGDLSVRLERMPGPGETLMGESGQFSIGGKGFNQAVAASRAGASVHLVGAVGKDAIADAALARLTAEDIGTDTIHRRRGATGSAAIMVDRHGENAIAVAPGANHLVTPDDIEDIDLAPYSVLVVQGELPQETTKRALTLARAQGLRTILNPAPAFRGMQSFLPFADIVTPNYDEAVLLAGADQRESPDIRGLIQTLMRLGAGQVIVTLSREGVCFLHDDEVVRLPSFPVDTVDTTGAGDVFTGNLAASIAGGAALSNAVTRAQAAAALSVTRATADSAPTKSMVDEFLRRTEA